MFVCPLFVVFQEYLCSVTANISTWVQQQILEANTILEAFGECNNLFLNCLIGGRSRQLFKPWHEVTNRNRIWILWVQDYLLADLEIVDSSRLRNLEHISTKAYFNTTYTELILSQIITGKFFEGQLNILIYLFSFYKQTFIHFLMNAGNMQYMF